MHLNNSTGLIDIFYLKQKKTIANTRTRVRAVGSEPGSESVVLLSEVSFYVV